MRQLKINEISSVLSWWSAQLTCRRRPGTFNCTFMVAMSFRAWSRSFRVKYDEACDRDHQNGSEFTHTSPYFSGEIDISMLKLIVSQVYPIIPTFIKAHQSSLAPFGCLHQLHPKTTVKICFQHIPQTSKNWSTQPSTNAGKVFWWYPHCFQESTTIFTNHSPTALQLPMAKNNVRYH